MTKSALRKVGIVAVVGFLIAMLAMQLKLAPQPVCSDCPAKFDIVSFEFALTPQRACSIIDSWDADAAEQACSADSAIVSQLRQGLYWDYLFALSYGLAGWLLARWVWSKVATLRRRLLQSMVPAAALLDGVENTALLYFLGSFESALALQIAYFCAALKFALLGLFVLLLLFAGWRRLVGAGWLAERWRWVLIAGQLLLLVRVPLLMVIIGAVLTLKVEQIAELFELSLGGEASAATWAWLFSALLGLLIWYSARTLYAFKQSNRADLEGNWSWLGKWLPRGLATVVPLTMLCGYAASDHDGALQWVVLYALQALALLTLTAARRPALRALQRRRDGPAAGWLAQAVEIDTQPQVNRLARWADLSLRSRLFHAAGIAVLILAGVVGAVAPALIDRFGPLALVLGAACWLVWASTYPVYWAWQHRVPLLTLVLLWGTALSWLGLTDNHAVRLVREMQSVDLPPAGLSYSAASASTGIDRLTVPEFIEGWAQTRPGCQRIYLVSSEGGGIRAALWTTLVLSELEKASRQGNKGASFWNCTVAASGVSGGSLGLAAFAAYMRDVPPRQGDDFTALNTMMTTPFLTPVLGSIFGADQLQRFLPTVVFNDRGQALEDRWISSYTDAVADLSTEGGHFAGPLAALSYDESAQIYPAMLLNSTVVQSGYRLIQHPFAPECEGKTCATDAMSRRFPGAVDGAQWLPAELPASSAALNSARFTLVSPAGTLRKACAECPKHYATPGQLVDGGYYENSGTATLADFHRLLTQQRSEWRKRIAVVHISNDVAIRPLMANGEDRCPGGVPSAVNATLAGEILAPATALYQTRSARGEQARLDLRNRLRADGSLGLWHFRLCQGQRPIPLGWTVGEETLKEMQQQLNGSAEHHAAGFPAMLRQTLGMGED